MGLKSKRLANTSVLKRTSIHKFVKRTVVGLGCSVCALLSMFNNFDELHGASSGHSGVKKNIVYELNLKAGLIFFAFLGASKMHNLGVILLMGNPFVKMSKMKDLAHLVSLFIFIFSHFNTER